MTRAILVLRLFAFLTRNWPMPRGRDRIAAVARTLAGSWPTDLVAGARDGRLLQVGLDEETDHAVYFTGDYEPQETEAVRALVEQGDIVLDIGAHIGWYTTLLSQLVGPSGSVHAFEPVPAAFGQLEGNVGRLARPENVQIHRTAVSATIGTTTIFTFSGLQSGHSSLTPQGRQDVIPIECATTTLDAFCTGLQVDFIKCDVEGAEGLVIEGAQRLLTTGHRPVWLLELTPHLAARLGNERTHVLESLAAAGYKCMKFGRGGLEWLENPASLTSASTNVLAMVLPLHEKRLGRLRSAGLLKGLP